MKITKIHSLGNDFIIIDEGETPEITEKEVLARQICKRHTGIGADGLLVINIRDRTRGLVDFRIFNADGTEPPVSGNGLRCAAAYLYHKKKVDPKRILFNTTVGSRECEFISSQNNWYQIKIEMGIPQFSSDDIPFDDSNHHDKIIDYPLSIHNKIYPITLLSLGNPHCALFFNRFPSRIEWQQLAYEIEFHPFFPKKVNIEFIRVINRNEIEVIFWERGVGETLSSGSGSCAAAVAAVMKGETERTMNVKTSMGATIVEWDKEKVYCTGPSQVVFQGNFLSY
jgi:diaminopimelate epimerase